MIRYEGTREELRREFGRMTDAKFTLYGYVREVILSRPGYQDGAHIRLICETIQSFLESD